MKEGESPPPALTVRVCDSIACELAGAQALLAELAPRGMVFIPFCYAEAPANVLTNDALDPFGKIAEVEFCAARVAAAVTG